MNRKIIEKYVRPLAPIPTKASPGGRLGHPVKCILFDIYGTLFISDSGDIGVSKSKDQQVSKVQKLIARHNLNINAAHLSEKFYGQIDKAHVRMRRKGIDFPEVEIDQIWMDILPIRDRRCIREFAVEFEWIVNPVYPMPHLADILEALRKRHLLMGIISNAQFFTPYLFSWYMDFDLQHLGFHPKLIFLSYRLKHAKPSLVPFEMAVNKLEKMGISASSVLYVGNDMQNDINPATSVGFQTALFAGDKRSLRLRKNDPACANTSPDLVITDLMQLLDYLK
jgi:putative hydrolase of the HAD superfamily